MVSHTLPVLLTRRVTWQLWKRERESNVKTQPWNGSPVPAHGSCQEVNMSMATRNHSENMSMATRGHSENMSWPPGAIVLAATNSWCQNKASPAGTPSHDTPTTRGQTHPRLRNTQTHHKDKQTHPPPIVVTGDCYRDVAWSSGER